MGFTSAPKSSGRWHGPAVGGLRLAGARGPYERSRPMLDLLIRDARVLDGSGNPWFRADVGVAEGRIAAIGRLASGPYQLSARRVIDAGGRVLCPGFIDTHEHSELAFLTEPTLEPKVRQGITTEVLGQDGISVAPVSDITRPQFRQRLAGLLGRDTEWDWSSVADYLDC